MATIGKADYSPQRALEQWYLRDAHPKFFGSFSDEERDEMITSDLLAGRSVPLLLTSVIFAGVCLAVISVLACW